MEKSRDRSEDTRNVSQEYAVKVDSDDAFAQKGHKTLNQDSEFTEIRRVGSNEDIQRINGEDHPLFNELTHEQQMELIARQEY